VKQVLQDRSGLTVVRDVPSPPCSPGSLLVRNAFSVISSGTERARVELAQKSLVGKARDRPDLLREVIERARREGVRATYGAVRRKLDEETPVGYSSAGVVLEVGEAVAGFNAGDRVACAGGGHANHAEIVSVPANLCAAVPDEVRLEDAALTTLAAIALHGIRLAEVQVGARVGVIGCGLVGQIACRLLRAAGAEVFAIDLDGTKVDDALNGGADHGFVVGEGTAEAVIAKAAGIGVDAVLVTAASRSNDPLLLASLIARDRAAVVLVGDVPITLPREALYVKELAFRVSRSYGPGRGDAEYEERGLDYPIGFVRWTEKRNMEAVLALLARGLVDFRGLVDEFVLVDDAARAYARLSGPAEGRPRGAVVLAYASEPSVPDDLAPIEVALRAPPERTPRLEGGRAPLRIALIGPGGFATRVLVPALRGAGAQLELVAGGAGPSAEAAQRTLGFARIAETEEAALGDPAVDAVIISTRHASHASLATRALQAGKHVFCEKPLALTLDELEEVLAAAAASPGILAVGFNRRFSQPLREVQAFLPSGQRAVASYRISAGAISSDHWVHDLSQGGGRALGEVCHFVDSLVFVTGSPVESVYAAGYAVDDAALQARDNLGVTLSFANGSVGTIVYAADGARRLPKERLEAFSGSRTAVLDDYKSVDLLGPSGRTRRRSRTQDKGHSSEIVAFIEGASRGEPPVPLVEVSNVSFATLAIAESLRTGRPVSLAGVREQLHRQPG
jgi:predicted dehydrogenase/threonine dehydrogenase-like Zn-dependent dehydrogenase